MRGTIRIHIRLSRNGIQRLLLTVAVTALAISVLVLSMALAARG